MKKRVFITAGARGIGRAIALKFISEGAQVAICDADSHAVSSFAAEVPQVIARTADVTDEASFAQVTDELDRLWRGIDVLCANAGIGGPAGRIESLSYEDWQRCVAVNLHGSFLACRWAAGHMSRQKSGSIIMTSSTAGIMGYPYRSPYAAAKWAIVGLTKTLAMELGPDQVRVNAICPGAVVGDRMDRVIENEARARNLSEDEVRANYVKGVSMKTWVTAEEIAETVGFLASEAGSKISGQVLSVDGHTETLAP